MADIKKGANEPFLYDDQTDRITGLKNSDATEKKFVYTDGSSGDMTVVGTLTATQDAFINGARVGIGPAGTNNTVLGVNTAGSLAAGADQNTLIGRDAGQSITDQDGNTYIGFRAGRLSTASNNTCVGTSTLTNAGTGALNTAIGGAALSLGGATANNTAIGFRALTNLAGATYDSNVAIGLDAGRRRGTGTDDLTQASASIFIGADARPSGNTETNQIVIANQGRGDGSNTTVIGNTSTTSTRIAGTATSVFAISGDTMRITGTRTPASNAAGTAGDFTFGTTGGTTYLYYCIASGNWGRVALTTGY